MVDNATRTVAHKLGRLGLRLPAGDAGAADLADSSPPCFWIRPEADGFTSPLDVSFNQVTQRGRMNGYIAARREKLAEIIGDEQVPTTERIDSAHDFLEQEVREAFRRGYRQAQERRPDARTRTDARSRDGRSALRAGMLTPIAREEV